jgi:hypothetical protein
VEIKERERAYREKYNAEIKALRSNAPEASESEKEATRIDSRNARLKKKYGLTIADYNKMLGLQNGKCAICCISESKGRGGFHVDHCHTTNKVRGLLCHSCNTGLGHFRDDIEILDAAAKYLLASRKFLK